MALTIWTKNSGYSFGDYAERQKLEIELPVLTDPDVTYSVISGALPSGIRIQQPTLITPASLVGTPYEVARTTEYIFCIRASKLNTETNVTELSDRTFKLSVSGADTPVFTTPEGNLDIGPYHQYFVLDSSFVDYQIEAYDFDTAAGQRLSYFVASGDGELPPGLVLTDDGRLVGFVQPVLSIKPEDGDGTYDDSYYDAVAYDFAYRPTNGYDSYIYDNVFYDFALSSGSPRKLNRNYEFYVSVTDGDTVVKRRFNIFVVGDDYFRADNTTWLDSNGLFTADVTYLRSPIWITPSNLGIYRANNYVTLVLDTYDRENVGYELELVNAICTATTKQKLITDNIEGGYSFTVSNASTAPLVGHYFTLTNINGVGDIQSTDTFIGNGYTTDFNLNYTVVNIDYTVVTLNNLELTYGTDYTFINDGATLRFETIDGIETPPGIDDVIKVKIIEPALASSAIYYISSVQSLGNKEYRLTVTDPLELTIPDDVIILIGTKSILPPGMNFERNNSEVFGRVPYQPAITTTYNFTVTATRLSEKGERAKSSRMFTIQIIGEVDSEIQWVSPSNLGSINANFVSLLNVKATSTVPNANLLYTQLSGSLPPGLSLDLDGEIVGKVNQYATFDAYDNLLTQGLTTFDYAGPNGVTTFDNGLTTVDRVFKFTVEARDQYNFSASTKEFSISIETPNEIVYSNLRVKPYLKTSQRSYWRDFINDTAVFTPSSIYRPNDTNFGLQTELSMIIYAGIETTEAAAYVSAMGLNHKRKRFQFGNVKKAVAIDPVTREQVYEVVYVEMVDPLEPNGNVLPSKLSRLGAQTKQVTIDSSTLFWQAGFWKDAPITDEQQAQIDKLSLPMPANERPEPIITIDSTGYFISDSNPNTYFPNSISNWRKRIKSGYKLDGANEVALQTERNYLPLWMRSIQPGTKEEVDFKLAVPLCYCKVGTADDIILNIKYSEFDFKLLDYTADRYIIDSVEGETGDKYLVFRNDRITV